MLEKTRNSSSSASRATSERNSPADRPGIPPRKKQIRPEAEVKDPGFAYTLAKGFQILESFTPDQRLLGNKDFWRITNLNRSTISRLTKTLCDLGYLKASESTKKYELGLAVLSLAYPRLLNLPIRRIAHPVMQDLADAVHGVVNLGMRFETIGTRPEIGARRGFETTVGKVYLAGLREPARSTLMAQLKDQQTLDMDAVRSKVNSLARELKTSRFCYFSVPGFHAIASAFEISPDGEMVVIDCVVENITTTKEKMLAEIAPRFVRMIGSIQEALGLRPHDY
jgi:DNA-binding IclR family transcriptional regulator